MGALLASVIPLPPRLPSYNVDIRKTPIEDHTGASNIWLRPSFIGPSVLPSLCSFAEGKRGLRYLGLAYTRTSTGAVHIDSIEPVPDAAMVLVIGTPAPPCHLIARLSALSGPQGWLFRGLMSLWRLQVLRVAV